MPTRADNFGWPGCSLSLAIASSSASPERAARAGLALLDAIAKLNEQPGHPKLSARVGIDSGLVAIGKGTGNEAEVFGEVPNVASRVHAAAEPGTVAISVATQRLVSGFLIVEDCGRQSLTGAAHDLRDGRRIRTG